MCIYTGWTGYLSSSINSQTVMAPSMTDEEVPDPDQIRLAWRPVRARCYPVPSPPPPSMLEYFSGGFRMRRDITNNDNSRNFGRQTNPTRSSPNQQPSRTNTSSPSANSPSSLYPPSLQQAQAPPSPSGAPVNMNPGDQMQQSSQNGRKLPIFFREEYVGFIVKGNFMTLAAKPTLVEEGEWLSHQGKS